MYGCNRIPTMFLLLAVKQFTIFTNLTLRCVGVLVPHGFLPGAYCPIDAITSACHVYLLCPVEGHVW